MSKSVDYDRLITQTHDLISILWSETLNFVIEYCIFNDR